jgi:hypothetical protein
LPSKLKYKFYENEPSLRNLPVLLVVTHIVLRNCCFVAQTSHFIPEQAGEIFKLVQPKLSVIHHATVNDASREALITDVSSFTAFALTTQFVESF